MAIEEPLKWQIDLGAAHPEKRRIVLVIAAVVLALGFLLPTGGALLGAVGFLMVTISNAEVFLPQRFEVGPTGVSRRCGLSFVQMDWEQVKRVEASDTGAHCSPFEKPSRLDAFRGVHLVFLDNREEVLAKISGYRDGDKELLGRGDDHRGGGAPRDEDRPRNHEAPDGGPRHPDA